MTEIQSKNQPENPTFAYVGAFVDELQRSGVHHIVFCPGSRSTPLAIAFAQHPTIRTWLHIDERSAAFFALGLAKRLTAPVALLCTSGTAAANFLPAVVEAKLTHIPLLILTADRPHELRECGAPQAIDQNRIYGTHVKWYQEAALPEATNTGLRYIRTLACRAAALTMAFPAGPVHLNFPFREPLTPDPQPLPPLEQRDPIAWNGRPDGEPYVTVSEAHSSPYVEITAGDRFVELARKMAETPRTLIVVGPHLHPRLPVMLAAMARAWRIPVLADPLSQLRGGPTLYDHIITSYDAFLRDAAFIEQAAPELIIRFGAMPVSKPLLLYMKRYKDCPQVVIDGYSDWPEPTQLASEVIQADPVAVAQYLFHAVKSYAEEPQQSPGDIAWLRLWQRADSVTRQTLRQTMEHFEEPFEGRLFTELAETLPANSILFAGNSMPVRDLDTFFWHTEKPVAIYGNRGANGIDGVVSTALGISAATTATGEKEPVFLVIGDLSFFHDMNGLLAAHLHKLDLTIILVNNDGGGIFSFLPQAAHPEHFEALFGTPTGLEFHHVVEMYNGNYALVSDWSEFRAFVEQSVEMGGLHVIELRTERESNVQMHRQLWQAVSGALAQLHDTNTESLYEEERLPEKQQLDEADVISGEAIFEPVQEGDDDFDLLEQDDR
ncbi:2-succinyl-5-enolpyruvyl-6-hydroxy-3-cyclohexene-1-carboxylate synthase [Thermosporothrix hazakensis]|jgi:2-succinyl-5-enolpyruvyl-6-hydroxy-3-cyclohexene-1-carboxylate synthase|uniref:2-succinyl-5-enolpyruvyl-6-hydroxy-3-cyclohexene-1-carboxylate synthase n=2 Tax=Thermosporothrix TaxID=768650 RepID=A0A326UEY6_THEHA|nr:2-succinyl-5-enolpyruvyl-6-hydroxy-3-cyclohexene-1-carboxylic-acid synthase [Thermosporothrix hazakensis]PZW36485.1 2-succinyl-5-enolpyruvyl-6-hydroxy-3-cyclohexene-1-carboxylate synthase [Thermosporothrix hazakensis]BBH88954.1 2-succinyl-5-enolpyruvyl-6-hydroxy-3-cyclohexene- 1-carboxylate synthase [Thermosporothrix sp. COM3]GCE47139.1 2-succinyl-5-enolpyruvyl-6-hydroxy-3-cyclohexene- 1-carboxylate synthase [Thermosporothrix hazakensis]